jgi:hypothetical protein
MTFARTTGGHHDARLTLVLMVRQVFLAHGPVRAHSVRPVCAEDVVGGSDYSVGGGRRGRRGGRLGKTRADRCRAGFGGRQVQCRCWCWVSVPMSVVSRVVQTDPAVDAAVAVGLEPLGRKLLGVRKLTGSQRQVGIPSPTASSVPDTV